MEPNLSTDPSTNGKSARVVETVVQRPNSPAPAKTGAKALAVLVLPGLFLLTVLVVGWLAVVSMTNRQQESRSIPREPTAPTHSP